MIRIINRCRCDWEGEERGGRGVDKEEGWIERVDWSEETREEFRKRTEEIVLGKG